MNLINGTVLKFKEFIKMSFIKDVGILQIGNILSVLLGTAGSIILARLLRPEAYGMYGLIFAFVGVVGIFMNWGADYAGLTLLAEAYARKDKNEIINILAYYIKLVFWATFIVGVLGIVFGPLITQLLYHDSQIGSWGRVVLIGICCSVVYNMLNMILQASRRIKRLVVLETLNKFVFTLLPIIFVLLGLGLSGLVWGYFVSALMFLFVSFFVLRFLLRKEETSISFREIFSNFNKINFKKYFNFGFLIAINKNTGSLLSLLPIVILGALSSTADVAYFKIALGYIGLPLMALDPVSRLLGVQLPKSKTYGGETLKKHFLKVSLWSGLISLCLMVPFVVFAPFLIKLFYGVEYIDSIKLVYWLSVFGVISGFNLGLGPAYRTLNKMKVGIATTVFEVILMASTAFILMRFYSPLVSMIVSLVVSLIIFSIINFYILDKLFKKFTNENSKFK